MSNWYERIRQASPDRQKQFVDSMEQSLGIDILTGIASDEGVQGTIWGPCMSPAAEEPCQCPACKNANRIDERGLDWDEEYEKAKQRGFDRWSLKSD